MSPEQLARKKARQLAWARALSPEQRARRNARQLAWARKRDASLTPEERAKAHEKEKARKRAWTKTPAGIAAQARSLAKRKGTSVSPKHRSLGISAADLDRMFSAQNGNCAICGEARPLRGGPGVSLHLDHDHKTGRVRGLLCVACNTALGSFRDNPANLRRALEYLERP